MKFHSSLARYEPLTVTSLCTITQVLLLSSILSNSSVSHWLTIFLLKTKTLKLRATHFGCGSFNSHTLFLGPHYTFVLWSDEAYLSELVCRENFSFSKFISNDNFLCVDGMDIVRKRHKSQIRNLWFFVFWTHTQRNNFYRKFLVSNQH